MERSEESTDHNIEKITSLDDVPILFERIFNQVDQDKNKYVSPSEITRKRYSESTTGAHALVLDCVWRNLQRISDLSSDEWGAENDGVTVRDLRNLRELIKKDGKLNSSQQLLVDDLKTAIPELRNVREPRSFALALMSSYKELSAANGDITKARLAEVIESSDPVSEIHQVAIGVNQQFDSLLALHPDSASSITWCDVIAFRYGVDPRFGFERELQETYRVRYKNISEHGIRATVAGGCAAVLAVATEASPRSAPVTGPLMLSTSYVTGFELGRMYSSYIEPVSKENDYVSQKKALESWKFFSR